jgi:hypothetical protein
VAHSLALVRVQGLALATTRRCGIIRTPMSVKRVIVCEAQVPFVHGGA